MNNLYYKLTKKLQGYSKNVLFTRHYNYSIKDLDVFSSKLAYLLANLDMLPGDRLAVYVEKSEYSLFLYLACLRAGIIYLPLNNTYTHEELNYFFDDAQPKIIICDPKKELIIKKITSANNSLIRTLDENGFGSLIEEMREIKKTEYDIYPAKPDDIAAIIYTSGTTGKPKGAMLTHEALFCNAQDLIQTWDIVEHDRILHMLPLFHVHGLFFSVHTAMIAGASLILLPKFGIDEFFEYLPQSTVFMGVPTHYIRLLHDHRLNQKNCRHMRLFISGSAPLLSSTFEDFQTRTGHTLLERYGMTETGIIASNPIAKLRKIGTVGLSLPHVNVRIVNDNNQLSDINQIGHIQVEGNNLFAGYWMNSDKTKLDFTDDGYFKTGDLGKFDDDGYLFLIGRSKDIVITGGLNVYPKELELTIDSIAGVIESAIIGIPHLDFGEAVVAVIAASQYKVNEELVINTVRQYHAGYKCPKKVFFVDELPKNTMGKIQKNILRDKFSKVFI